MQAFSVRFLRNSHSKQFSTTVPKYINKRFYSWRSFSNSPLAINHPSIGFLNKTYKNSYVYSFSTNSTQYSSNTENTKDANADSQKETSSDGESDEELFEAAAEDENGETDEVQNALDDAEERILELEKEVKKWKDNLIRSHADIINLQNMNKKDIEREKLYSNKNFARDMLEVNDALIMALKGIKESEKDTQSISNLKSVVDGIELTHRILLNTFSKHGIKKINSLDEIFDPSKHEALFQIETDEYPSNIVREVINDGFQIRDKILRSAKVGITCAPAKPVEQISVANEEESEENKNDSK